VSACDVGGNGSPDGEASTRRLAAPTGTLFNVAWLPDGRIYFGRAVDAGGRPETWRIPASGGTAEQLRLADQPGCRLTKYLRVAALPDGQLGLARFCSKDPPLATDTGAVDPRSGRYQPLAPLGDLNPSAVVWRKGLRSGFISYTTGTCAGLAPLSRRGPQRLPGPVTVDGRSWRLDEDVFAPGGADCTDRGRADLPVLSPDERLLYFVASPESVGVTGRARTTVPWNLYRWPLTGAQPQELTRGLGQSVGLAISPDGRALVFAGLRDGDFGLWLVDSSTRQVRRLAGGRFVSCTFSPDGRQVAAIADKDVDHSHLDVFDLP